MQLFGGDPKDIFIGLLPLLANGLYITLRISLISLGFSIVVGLLFGIIRYSKVLLVHWGIGGYVDLMRGLPFLIILYSVYFIGPLFVNFRLREMQAAVLALVLHEGAYFTEIVRGSLESIPKSQTEAAKALGLNYFQRMRYVLLPQMIRIALPPVAGEVVLLIKHTSVVSLIGVIELTRIGRAQMQTNLQPLLTFALVGIFYFIICYPMLRLSLWLEKKTKGVFQSRE